MLTIKVKRQEIKIMIKRKLWKTGVAIAVVLSMQTDVAVYAVNTDGEVQVTRESDITQEENEAAVIEERIQRQLMQK